MSVKNKNAKDNLPVFHHPEILVKIRQCTLSRQYHVSMKIQELKSNSKLKKDYLLLSCNLFNASVLVWT